MTLQNGCITGSTAFLWTDTAHWNAKTGEVVCQDTKLFQLQTWPAAGVLSCIGGNPHEIAFAVGNAWPQDVPELLDQTAKALRSYCLAGGSGRVLLASHLDRPRLHMVASDGAGLGAPFEPVELLSFTSSGTNSAAYHLAIANGFTPERMALVIDAQIAEPFEGTGSLAAFGKRNWIGGNIVEIAVTSKGVESRVLRSVDAQAA
jgi:hypothetical protein